VPSNWRTLLQGRLLLRAKRTGAEIIQHLRFDPKEALKEIRITAPVMDSGCGFHYPPAKIAK
jgi:hypothetical protein